MRLTMIALALWALLGTPAAAQDVPAAKRGIWNIGACDEVRAAVALGRDFAILFQTDPGLGRVVAIADVAWSNDMALLQQDGVPMVLPLWTMTRCPTMPPPAYAAMGEALALFAVLDDITATCYAGVGRDCARAIFAFADVSADERLSLAEVTRLVRAGATFVSYEAMRQSAEHDGSGEERIWVPVGQLSGTSALMSFTGPMITRNLLASYDFDGDGFLTLDEVMQDREALFDYSVPGATGTVLGTAFAQSLVSNSVTFFTQGAGQMLAPVLGGMLR